MRIMTMENSFVRNLWLAALFLCSAGCVQSRDLGSAGGLSPAAETPLRRLLLSKSVADRHEGIARARRSFPIGERDILVNLALRDPVPGVAMEASMALGAAGDDSLQQIYLRHRKAFAGKKNAPTRQLICSAATWSKALTKPACLQALYEFTRDPDIGVRKRAYYGLGRASTQKALEILLARQRQESDQFAKSTISESIRRWHKAERYRKKTPALKSGSAKSGPF